MPCNDCKFFHSETSACRKHPPQFHVLLVPRQSVVNGHQVGVQNVSGWPTTGPDEWCGEHQPAVRFQGIGGLAS